MIEDNDRKAYILAIIMRERLIQPGRRFADDLDGNLLSDHRWSYTWDAENRLITMETLPAAVSAGVPRLKLEFTYDSQSRRVSKKKSTWNPGSGSYESAGETRFLYDGWLLLAELGASGGGNTLLRSYTWGLDLSGSLQGAGGIGGLLWITDATSSTSAFSIADGNGNVIALVDATSTTAATLADYEYDPFGRPLRATGPWAASGTSGGTSGGFRFSTKYTDAESGLLYFGYRYYYPTPGRWLNRDPLEEEGGFNLLSFVSNDGISDHDMLGLSAVSKGLKGLILRGGKEISIKAIRKQLREAGMRGFARIHHIIPQKVFKDEKYGKWLTDCLQLTPDNIKNLMKLPGKEAKEAGFLADRALHSGMHVDEYFKLVENKIAEVMKEHVAGRLTTEKAKLDIALLQHELRRGLKNGKIRLQKVDDVLDKPVAAFVVGLGLSGISDEERDGILEANVDASIEALTESLDKAIDNNPGKYLRLSNYTGNDGFLGWVGWGVDLVNPGDDVATVGDLILAGARTAIGVVDTLGNKITKGWNAQIRSKADGSGLSEEQLRELYP